MRTQDFIKSKPLKLFVKSTFVLIGLLFILSYGVAALLLHFNRNIEISKNFEIKKNHEIGNDIETGKNYEIKKNYEVSKNRKNNENIENIENNVFKLILILVCLPILVLILAFLRFSCLMKLYYDKLYDPLNNEGIIVKMQQHEIQKFKKQKKIEMKKHKIHKIKALIKMFFMALKTLKPDSEKNWEALLKKLEELINLFSKCSDKNCDYLNGGGI